MLLHKQTKMEKESALIAYMPREIAGVIVAFLLVVLGTFSIVVWTNQLKLYTYLEETLEFELLLELTFWFITNQDLEMVVLV